MLVAVRFRYRYIGRTEFHDWATMKAIDMRIGLRCVVFLISIHCFVGLPSGFAASGEHASRPNVVIFLVDDMGWSDIGCYGSEIPTPNIDALAQSGVRFTQFYNTARCSPTRASLMTG